jgi:hypothetical protein
VARRRGGGGTVAAVDGRRLVFIAVAATTLTAGCADAVVVNTGDPGPHTATTDSATSTVRVDANLVDAHAYYVTSDDVKGYYFTTPSAKWNCAIVPRVMVGCQAAGAQSMGVPGGPPTVANPDGKAVAPNAIAVSVDGEPGFTWLARPGFSPASGKAMTLDFKQTLAAAGFRCNVQDAGVSCLSEGTHKGFTFSATGFTPQYTPVPG